MNKKHIDELNLQRTQIEEIYCRRITNLEKELEERIKRGKAKVTKLEVATLKIKQLYKTVKNLDKKLMLVFNFFL